VRGGGGGGGAFGKRKISRGNLGSSFKRIPKGEEGVLLGRQDVSRGKCSLTRRGKKRDVGAKSSNVLRMRVWGGTDLMDPLMSARGNTGKDQEEGRVQARVQTFGRRGAVM